MNTIEFLKSIKRDYPINYALELKIDEHIATLSGPSGIDRTQPVANVAKSAEGPGKLQRLFDALKTIASYNSPERVRRDAPAMGLDENEAVEMAYENVLQEARSAIRGMRRPK